MPNKETWLTTFGDPELIRLNAKVQEWWERFTTNDRPCWLVMLGKSGNGKTHCARQLYDRALRAGLAGNKPTAYTEHFMWWPDMVNELHAQRGYDLLADTKRWSLLAVDEIGANRDISGFVADRLYFMLAQREKKWTIITSNLTLNAFTQMDERLTSRAFRNNGIVVEVNTIDYNLRPNV